MKQTQLWQKVVAGDRIAFGIIFRTYYDELFNYGLRFSKDPEVIRDALQELFLKIWKFRETISEIQDVKPYIFKMFRNQLVDHLKSDSRFFFRKDTPFHEEDSEFSAEDFIIHNQVSKETRDKLALALRQLSPRQRETIYLRFYHGMEIGAIADILQVNVQSVRNNIFRAMCVMRKSF